MLNGYQDQFPNTMNNVCIDKNSSRGIMDLGGEPALFLYFMGRSVVTSLGPGLCIYNQPRGGCFPELSPRI